MRISGVQSHKTFIQILRFCFITFQSCTLFEIQPLLAIRFFYLSACSLRTRLGADPVRLPVPPILAAYAIQSDNAFPSCRHSLSNLSSAAGNPDLTLAELHGSSALLGKEQLNNHVKK